MNIRKLASLSLAAALQVLPLSRVFVAAAPATGSSFAIVSTWIAGLAALLGGVDAVSGASSISISPATATTGVPYSGAVIYSGAHASSAKSWQLTKNWNGIQSGCNTIYEIAPGLWLTNAATYLVRIGGTPTTAGTFNFTLKIHSGTGCSGGDSDTRSASITISGGTATAPVITTQPLSKTVTAGGSASFSVTASGTAPLTYQWKKNGSNVSGGTSSSLTLNPVALGDAGIYTCAVSNSVGSATSSAATLTVNAAVVAPSITTQPASQTVTAGGNVSFTVAAGGTASLSYQWRLNGANLAGATSATLTLSAVTTGQSGGSYSCVVSNSAGSATSSAATLTVNAAAVAPSITTQPASQTVTAGANVSFTVAANGTAPLSYQWRLNGANLAGATSATLTLSAVTTGQSGGSYSCVVSNSAGSATSSAATLTVNAAVVAPSITTQPASQTVTAGGNATFGVTATGTAPLGYQWRLNGANVAGATSATLSLTGVTTNQAGNYSAVVANSSGSVTSSVATLTVVVPPAITTQPASQTVIAGGNATFTVTAMGTAPLSYQWRLNGANVAGATGASLSLTGVTTNQAGNYSAVVANSSGSITSSVAPLTVLVPPAITTQPASQTVTIGDSVTFNVTAAGTAPLSYQWRLNGANVTGATTATLSLTGVTTSQAGNYVVLVSNSAGSVTSSPAILTVTAAAVAPTITAQPANQTVTAGANVSFTVTANGTAPLSYQWRLNGANLTGATSATLTLSAVTTGQSGGSYSCVVSNSAGSATSSAATLTVNAAVAPTITMPPASQTVTVGGNATFSVTATGTAPLSYQWRRNGANVAGATSATLVLTGVTTNQAGSYVVLASNSAGSVTSSPAILTVNAPTLAPTITTQPASQTVTAGGNATFNVTATGTAPLSYQWRKNGANVAGGTSSTLALTSVTTNQAGSYVVLVSNSAGSVTSSPASLTVTNPIAPDTALPTVTIFLQPLVPVYTNAITLSGTAADDRGVANVSVQKGNGAFVSANGTTNWVATVALDPGTNTIRVKATDTSGNEQFDSRAIIFVVATPLTLTINGDGVVAPLTNGQLLELGQPYSVTATANPGSVFNNWIVDGVTNTSSTLMFTMSSNLTITANFLAGGSSGVAGVYSGLFYPNTSEPSFEQSGFFTLNVSAKGTFTGKLLLADATYPLKGEFDDARSARLSIQSKAANALQVDLQLTVGSDQITGSVGDGSWQSDLGGYRAAGKNSVNPFAGRYTMLFSSEDNSGASPLGYGGATLTVDTSGRVVLKGVLADGSPAIQSVPVAANGQVPLFVRLPRGKDSTLAWLTKGSILGWLTLTNSATNDTPGSLWWTQRAGAVGTYYPAGFSVKVLTMGSRYTRPDKGTSRDTGGVLVSLDGGNLTSPLINEALWSDPSHITVVTANPFGLTLTMSASTGLLKGKFVHPQTGMPSAIRGVFLQKQNFGGGFFLGTDQSGAVVLESAGSVP